MNAPETPAPAVTPQAKTVLVALTHDDGVLIISVGTSPQLLRKSDTHAQLLALVLDPATPAAKTAQTFNLGETIKDVARIFAGDGT